MWLKTRNPDALWLKSFAMNRYLTAILVVLTTASYGQALRDINYEYVYNPDATVQLDLRAVRSDSMRYTILYNLQVSDTAALTSQYSLVWEIRDLLGDKEGRSVSLDDAAVTRHARGLRGRGTIDSGDITRYLVARVTNNSLRRAWLFYVALQPNYPVDNYLLRNGFPLTDPYVGTGVPVKLGRDMGSWIVSYYDDDFPAAAPAFSEAQARVPRAMDVDSTFVVSGTTEFDFSRKGLYLIQRDTNAIAGLAVRAEDDYPQYSKLANLADPLVYITTRQEFERLAAARGNKKAFDRMILAIVVDADRARQLMRSYFRRVELANRYFTSYKEGWKTDRGMIYIIFGAPQQVYRFENREVWTYGDRFDISFTFTRSSSLFDPDNYVLIRRKKYESTWYEVIDLWRNARF